jgi:hypothetical protein
MDVGMVEDRIEIRVLATFLDATAGFATAMIDGNVDAGIAIAIAIGMTTDVGAAGGKHSKSFFVHRLHRLI